MNEYNHEIPSNKEIFGIFDSVNWNCDHSYYLDSKYTSELMNSIKNKIIVKTGKRKKILLYLKMFKTFKNKNKKKTN